MLIRGYPDVPGATSEAFVVDEKVIKEPMVQEAFPVPPFETGNVPVTPLVRLTKPQLGTVPLVVNT